MMMLELVMPAVVHCVSPEEEEGRIGQWEGMEAGRWHFGFTSILQAS